MSLTVVMEERSRFTDRLRTLPVGILLLVALLAILGIASLAGSVYLLMQDGDISLWAVATGIVGGPILLYLAYNLALLARWTWTTLIVLAGLMAISSVVRLIVAPGVIIAPAGELVVELASAIYLTRPRVRGRFGLGRAAAP